MANVERRAGQSMRAQRTLGELPSVPESSDDYGHPFAVGRYGDRIDLPHGEAVVDTQVLLDCPFCGGALRRSRI